MHQVRKELNLEPILDTKYADYARRARFWDFSRSNHQEALGTSTYPEYILAHYLA